MGQRSWAICACVLFMLSQCTGSFGCLELERRALLHLSSVLDFRGWAVGQESDCCAWERVKCNTTTHRVTQLSLSGLVGWESPFLNMSYFLPFQELHQLDLSHNTIGYENPHIGKLMGFERLSELKKFEVLNLEGNVFGSRILPSLGAIKSLKSLKLGWNQIGGDSVSVSELSRLFTNLRNLEVLDLSFNDLNGSFPFQDLENMSKLKTLNLSYNNFSRNIPRSLSSLSSLESLFLKHTYLADSLAGFCELKNLRDLDIGFNKFRRSIPPCIGNLTSLRKLDISGNELTGNIPPSLISSLTYLKLLDFSKNQLSGKIPMSSISNLTSLQFISFNDNQFGGFDLLPMFVGHKSQFKILGLSHCNLNMSTTQLLQFLHNQYSLVVIDLSSNNLHGKFPNWLIGNNTRLEILRLRNNLINGHVSFPHHLRGSLKIVDVSINHIQGELQKIIGDFMLRVQSLNLSQNSLEGRIPSSLGNLQELSSLDLSSNNISGEIPEALGFSCKRLTELILSNNRLEGQISPAIFELPTLQSLRLNNNQLTGDLASLNIHFDKDNPAELMYPLQTLDISQNLISGRVPSWVANFSQLTSVSMRHNSLCGPIPMVICNSNLKFLDLSQNHISGSLPSCLSSTPLRYIHLHSNNLTGTIPKEFFESSDLLTLDLMRNQLSGSIPCHVGASVNLRILLLKGNHLSGSVPRGLCKMSKISILDLSHNNFSGSIPPCIGNIIFGRTEAVEPAFQDAFWSSVFHTDSPHNFEAYMYAGETIVYEDSSDQEEVYFLTKGMDSSYKGGLLNFMAGIDLSCNQFTGIIPVEVGALTGVHALNFSHNQLTGHIPTTLSHLKQLESMDLSHNKLRGQIPSDLIGLYNLEVFTVAYNNLSGRLPDMKAQFSTFQETSYEGNPLLCGPPLKKQCNHRIADPVATASLSGLSVNYGIDFVSFLASFAAACTMCLLGLVTVLYVNPYWRRLWFDSVDACISFVFPFFSEAIYRTSNPFT